MGDPFYARKCGIDSLSTFGDSKIIIEWEKGLFNLHVFPLKSWCRRTKVWISSFIQVSFLHISMIFNSESYKLSKLVASYDFGTLHFPKVIDGKFSMIDLVSLDQSCRSCSSFLCLLLM